MSRAALFRRSFRARIMLCVLASIVVLVVFFAITAMRNQDFLQKTGRTYETNTKLNEVSANILATEVAMENYVAYKTFESIDTYYHFQALAEESLAEFDTSPSTDKVKLGEYSVFQLATSFFYYSRKAVSFQRANDFYSMRTFYKKSLECYSMLQKEIEKLNSLLMERNAVLYKSNQKSFDNFVRISTIFIAIFSVLIFIVLYVTVTIIMTPLSEISSIATRVAVMDFDVPLFNSQAEDEIGNICRAFDRMIVSIKAYVDKIWEKVAQENELKEKELEMRELYSAAQLRALQNQINPHFLFNTLNTGAQLAMMEGADKTCYFIEQVADFFRYNIQQQGQAATLSEELSLVDNFVYIMKVRFGERLIFEKDLPADVDYSILLPRMILQPLVENCIKYGLKGEKGHVVLSVTHDTFVMKIAISDNGNGITEELRNQILCSGQDMPIKKTSAQAASASGTGTGLVNVASRLRLFFHRADVFDILTNEEGGTTFLLKIPQAPENVEKENNHV